ncbi:hypothetical protein K435DRAFT_960309 [Dendrothele bispora CBS 962.96]|uniref:Uncharacterized protein n=1 Tax=Dendrothele bispora (strain CBS 962.96) TaxID=1314807 RepID=A0A4S8MW71_DENBC|nr:hypothetical protein K435DRAFT_960309 [Dendrothele bispora CBS 962.96]
MGDNSITVSIILSALGGLALGISLILALILRRRRRQRKKDQVMNEMVSAYDVFSPITSGDSKYFSSTPIVISPPAVYFADQDQRAILDEKKQLPRLIIPPTIIPHEQGGSSCGQKTPKFRIKRVPVPRLSRLPPTPVAKTSKFVKRFSRKFKGGLPPSVRLPKDQPVPLPRNDSMV